MACDCSELSTRAASVGAGPGRLTASVEITSLCQEVGGAGEGEKMSDEESGEIRMDETRLLVTELEEELLAEAEELAKLCRVSYLIQVSAGSNCSVVQFVVDDEEFEFPVPIAPGKNDTVRIVRPQPANCRTEKAGKVKVSGPGGKTMTLTKFEVCVLS